MTVKDVNERHDSRDFDHKTPIILHQISLLYAAIMLTDATSAVGGQCTEEPWERKRPEHSNVTCNTH